MEKQHPHKEIHKLMIEIRDRVAKSLPILKNNKMKNIKINITKLDNFVRIFILLGKEYDSSYTLCTKSKYIEDDKDNLILNIEDILENKSYSYHFDITEYLVDIPCPITYSNWNKGNITIIIMNNNVYNDTVLLPFKTFDFTETN